MAGVTRAWSASLIGAGPSPKLSTTFSTAVHLRGLRDARLKSEHRPLSYTTLAHLLRTDAEDLLPMHQTMQHGPTGSHQRRIRITVRNHHRIQHWQSVHWYWLWVASEAQNQTSTIENGTRNPGNNMTTIQLQHGQFKLETGENVHNCLFTHWCSNYLFRWARVRRLTDARATQTVSILFHTPFAIIDLMSASESTAMQRLVAPASSIIEIDLLVPFQCTPQSRALPDPPKLPP